MSKATNKFSPEVRDGTCGWLSTTRISMRCVEGGYVDRGEDGRTPQTLNEWVKRAEVDSGRRAATERVEKMKALERENRELRQSKEILRKASTYFAMAEFDHRWR
jgi:transposase